MDATGTSTPPDGCQVQWGGHHGLHRIDSGNRVCLGVRSVQAGSLLCWWGLHGLCEDVRECIPGTWWALMTHPGEQEGAAHMSAHRCQAQGCTKVISSRLLMCPGHWRMVPRALQKALWVHDRLGQAHEQQPSQEYIQAALAAIKAVAAREAVAQPKRR